MTEREERLRELGVSVNADGSTNNLPEFYWYSRDTRSQSFIHYIMCYVTWALVAGTFTFYSSVYCFGNIINEKGHTNGYWNTLLPMVIVNVIAHHVLIVIETHNFAWFNLVFYSVSMSFLLLVIWACNSFTTDAYGMNQFSEVMSTPLFWLTLIMQLTVTVAPRYLDKVHEAVFRHPEFTMVKG